MIFLQKKEIIIFIKILLNVLIINFKTFLCSNNSHVFKQKKEFGKNKTNEEIDFV